MSQEKIDKFFLQQKNKLIRKYGRDGMYDIEIDKICKNEFKSKWLGCHSYDSIVFKPGFLIINTSKKGSHWVGIYITKSKIYIYDSFARNLRRILHRLMKIIPSKYTVIECNQKSDPEQRGESEVCGHISISFLMCVRDFGIKKAITI